MREVQLLEDDEGLLLMKRDIQDILVFGLGIFVSVLSFCLALVTGYALSNFIYGL